MLGNQKAINAMFPERFPAADGVMVPSCVDNAGLTVYGETPCADNLLAYKALFDAAGSIGSALTLEESALSENIKCFENDDPASTVVTGTANCVAVPIENGLYQMRNKSLISCINPVDQ
jgi:hypothetical protein